MPDQWVTLNLAILTKIGPPSMRARALRRVTHINCKELVRLMLSY